MYATTDQDGDVWITNDPLVPIGFFTGEPEGSLVVMLDGLAPELLGFPRNKLPQGTWTQLQVEARVSQDITSVMVNGIRFTPEES